VGYNQTIVPHAGKGGKMYPQIITESRPWLKNGLDENGYEPWPHELSYRLVVKESYRENGKIKKRQKHVMRILPWDMRAIHPERRTDTGEWRRPKSIDPQKQVAKALRKAFPDLPAKNFRELLWKSRVKLHDLISRCWKSNIEQDEEINAYFEEERKQGRAYTWEFGKEPPPHGKPHQPKPERPDVLTELLNDPVVFNAVYRAGVKKFHPDAGGDEEKMKELNRLRDSRKQKA
jgi:hypothetical protein